LRAAPRDDSAELYPLVVFLFLIDDMAKTLSVNLERALRSSGSGKGVAGLQKK